MDLHEESALICVIFATASLMKTGSSGSITGPSLFGFLLLVMPRGGGIVIHAASRRADNCRKFESVEYLATYHRYKYI